MSFWLPAVLISLLVLVNAFTWWTWGMKQGKKDERREIVDYLTLHGYNRTATEIKQKSHKIERPHDAG